MVASLVSREKIKLAVLDFEEKNISQSSAEAVTDLLRTELFNTGHFKVIERQTIQKIIDSAYRSSKNNKPVCIDSKLNEVGKS